MSAAVTLPELSRVICHFSCGAASAVATKIAIDRYGLRVVIVNAYVTKEHKDNRRFLADCETWFGCPIVVLRDTRYGASPDAVWRKKRFIMSRAGAPCSKVLKRDVLLSQFPRRPTDTTVIGYTADKSDEERFDRLVDANGAERVIAPLIEEGLTKRDCFEMVARAGIRLPKMYRLGYHNANCIGCPKGGEGYWNKIRRDFPRSFERMAKHQDRLGPGSYFFRNRKTGQRISLRMLSPTAGRFKDEPPVECGAFCEMAERSTLSVGEEPK